MRRVVLLAALLAVAPAAGQDLPGAGPEVFAGLLHFRGVRPASARVEPGDIVIVFNPPPRDEASQRLVRNVLLLGGSALLASDFAADWESYLPGSQARTTGERVVAPPGASWQRDPERPLALPNPELAFAGFLNKRDALDAVFRGRTRLATHRPAAMVVDKAGPWLAGPFAYFPPGSSFADGEELGLGVVAVGSTRAAGPRVLLLADPDVLANDLLTAVDAAGLPADNLPFADALVTWLSAEGSRTRCHFFVNGERVSDFQKVRLDGTPPIPLPEIDPLSPKLQRAMTDLANRSLAKAEAGGGLDQLLKGDRAEREPPRWLRAVGAVALGALAAYAVRRVVSPGRPPPGPARAGGAARNPSEPDITDPARDYLASLLAELGREAAGPVPTLAGSAARTLTPGFRMVWGVASGSDAAPISARRCAELAAHADALSAAFASGACSFRE